MHSTPTFHAENDDLVANLIGPILTILAKLSHMVAYGLFPVTGHIAVPTLMMLFMSRRFSLCSPAVNIQYVVG